MTPISQIRSNQVMVRGLLTIGGIVVAAIGGVIAYRAWFLEPSAAVVITETEVRELPNTLRVAGGLALLIIGAAVAFFAARRK
ncbi:MAG TPA: hypothetical protein VMM84_03675 [Pyrinomonadaceae bacterium]|nr:hypothetical protein [Pyrinomonadaceae bacterium]